MTVANPVEDDPRNVGVAETADVAFLEQGEVSLEPRRGTCALGLDSATRSAQANCDHTMDQPNSETPIP